MRNGEPNDPAIFVSVCTVEECCLRAGVSSGGKTVKYIKAVLFSQEWERFAGLFGHVARRTELKVCYMEGNVVRFSTMPMDTGRCFLLVYLF